MPGSVMPRVNAGKSVAGDAPPRLADDGQGDGQDDGQGDGQGDGRGEIPQPNH
ncbi:hypothetical protein [Pontixanthobacter sp.]|uniref:hypothetical protein n=1 Tax=Pontixanthobacter sp. TaxID=2792078 RepID=UPI003C7CE229